MSAKNQAATTRTAPAALDDLIGAQRKSLDTVHDAVREMLEGAHAAASRHWDLVASTQRRFAGLLRESGSPIGLEGMPDMGLDALKVAADAGLAQAEVMAKAQLDALILYSRCLSQSLADLRRLTAGAEAAAADD
ncbi:MAG TPA: hypothetical protein VMU85_12070 [Stellaceae bacterium]|nr:hypothetical protein [Stellaceae bacterium]